MPRKSEEERLADIERSIAEQQSAKQALMSRIAKKRKAEYSRKCFVIGDMIQKHGDIETIRSLLEEHVKDSRDRELLGLKSETGDNAAGFYQDPDQKTF